MPRGCRAALCALGLLVALVACKPKIPTGVFNCESASDCPSGQRCAAIDPDSDERRCVDDAIECSGDAPAPTKYTAAATWTSGDVSLCEVLCSDHEFSCIRDYCGHGSALATCVSRMHNECSSKFGGECRAEWVALWCCAESACADELGTDAGVPCLNEHCLEQSNAGDQCLEEDTACLEIAWDDCAGRATAGASDAAVPRLDGSVPDSGIKLDASVPRDAGTDAATDAAARSDAALDAGLPPIKDGGGPPAALTADAGKPLLDAASN